MSVAREAELIAWRSAENAPNWSARRAPGPHVVSRKSDELDGVPGLGVGARPRAGSSAQVQDEARSHRRCLGALPRPGHCPRASGPQESSGTAASSGHCLCRRRGHCLSRSAMPGPGSAPRAPDQPRPEPPRSWHCPLHLFEGCALFLGYADGEVEAPPPSTVLHPLQIAGAALPSQRTARRGERALEPSRPSRRRRRS